MNTAPTSPLDLVANACDLHDYESMVRGVFANPDDDLTRLIFADWLDDHGSATWAQLIRLQTQRQHPAASAFTDFEERQIVQPLLHWLVRNLPARIAVEFRRGFLDLTIEADHCAHNAVACRLLLSGLIENLRLVGNHYEPSFTVEPGDPLSLAGTLDLRNSPVNFLCLSRLAGLELPLTEGRTQRVLLSETHEAEMQTLRGERRATQVRTSLDFNNWGTLLQEDDVRRMIETPFLESVRDITMSQHSLGDALLRSLGRSEYGSKLQRLSVHNRAGVSDEGVLNFLNGAGWLIALNHLDLSGNSITEVGLKALLESPLAERLDRFNVTNNLWGDEGAMLLAEHTSRWGWQDLDLTGASISDAGLEALSASGHVRGFQNLHLSNAHGFSEAGLLALGRSPGWESLSALFLGSNPISPTTVFELLQSSALPNFSTIDQDQMTAILRRAKKRQAGGIDLMLRSPDPAWFEFLSSRPHLRALTLSGPFDIDVVADLLSRPGWTTLRELGINDCDLTDAQLVSILTSVDLPALERLDLTRNQLGAKSVRFLADWSGTEQLRELALGENRLGDSGARTLYISRKFAKLENLAVHDNRLSRESADGLVKAFRGRVKGG